MATLYGDLPVESLVHAHQAEYFLMTDMVVWHLLRLGHDPGAAHVRARLLVTTVEACTHEAAAGTERDQAIEELARLCAGYVRRA